MALVGSVRRDAYGRSVLPVFGVTAWTPDSLGASLYDYWDAEIAGTITTSGSDVSQWSTAKNAVAATQGTVADRPAYNATGLNGRPCITADGVSDQLGVASSANFPTGANASEIWALVSQISPPASGEQGVFSYGGGTAALSRSVRRSQTVTSRLRAQGGDGTTSVSGAENTVDFTGVHVVRAIYSGTTVTAEIDGVSGTPVALVPATGAGLIRLFCLTSNTGFINASLNWVGVTAPLSVGEATMMRSYLKARGGLP